MVSEHGRKFFATILGMSLVTGFGVGAMLLRADAEYLSAVATAVGAMVSVFCGANAVGDLAHARYASRQADAGTPPTESAP